MADFTLESVADLGWNMQEVQYSAYGQVLQGRVATRDGSSDGFSSGGFGFQGQWHDPTGLVHLRARQYDPQSGLFLSRDPVAGDPSTLGQTVGHLTRSLSDSPG